MLITSNYCGVQIYLTRIGSRHQGHHLAQKTREPETVVVDTGASEEKKIINNLRPFSHYDLAVTVFNSKGEGPFSKAMSFQTSEGGEYGNKGGKLGGKEARVIRLKRGEVIDEEEIQSQTGRGNDGIRWEEGRSGWWVTADEMTGIQRMSG